jgi:hypothetical protein
VSNVRFVLPVLATGLAASLVALLLAPAALPAAGAALEAQSPRVSVVHGAEIRVLMSTGDRLEGELMAVTPDRLWLLTGGSDLRTAGSREILRVDRQRHGLGTRRMLTWIGVGGGVTTAAMMVACGSVDDAGGCAGFGLLWAGAWALVGGISWALIRPGQRVTPEALEDLRPWARFPQGLPADFRPSAGRLP